MINRKKCPICKSEWLGHMYEEDILTNRNKIHEVDFLRKNRAVKSYVDNLYFYALKRCFNCDHVFQRTAFDPYQEYEFFRHMYEGMDIDECKAMNGNSDEEIKKEVDVIKGITAFFDLLDVGASFGDFLRAKWSPFRIYAYDICKKSNTYLMDQKVPVYDNIHGISKRFNTIRVSHVLSHRHNDIHTFINQLMGHLHRNGIIYFIDHKTLDRKLVEHPLWHMNIFSETSFNLLMSSFKNLRLIKDVKDYPYFFKIYRRIP